MQKQFLQTFQSGTYGDCTLEVLRQRMTKDCLKQLTMKGIHGKIALAGTKMCSLVVGEH